PTPANMILVLVLKLAAPKLPFSVSESVSPFSFTKPPMGSQLRLKMKPFLVFRFQARGGKPMPNSSTSTPFRRAAQKWPNSCKTTSPMNNIIPRTSSSTDIYPLYLFKLYSLQNDDLPIKPTFGPIARNRAPEHEPIRLCRSVKAL